MNRFASISERQGELKLPQGLKPILDSPFGAAPSSRFACSGRALKGRSSTVTLRFIVFLVLFCESALVTIAQPASPSDSGFPSCTESLSTVAVPNAPHGLFAILFPDVKMRAKAEQFLLHKPVVCGANMYLVWNEIDHGDGRYDFSKVEEEMRPWIKAGKQVNLISWATGYGGKVQVTPDYVFRQAESVSCQDGEVPVFWEKGFVENYQKFMTAIIQHFGNNPAVGYIRFGLGLGGETFPACVWALKSKGFTPERWKKYLFDMLEYEGTLHSPKQLMVGINSLPGPMRSNDLPDSVARRAVQNKIGIGSQGLSIEDARADEAGSPCEVDWCHVFREAAGKVPLELQSVKQSNPDGDGRVGSMVDILPFALKLRTQIFEIYVQDWLVAYDPSDPNYDRHHKEYQQAFEAAARVVGAR